MFFPERMKKARVIVLDDQLDALLDSLAGKGLFHVSDAPLHWDQWAFLGQKNAPGKNYAEVLSHLDELLGRVKKEAKYPVLEVFSQKRELVSEASLDIPEIVQNFDAIHFQFNQLDEQKKKLQSLEKELEKNKKGFLLLKSFASQISKEFEEDEVFYFGSVDEEEFAPLMQSLKANLPHVDSFDKKTRVDREPKRIMVLLVKKQFDFLAQQILQRYGFDRIDLPKTEERESELIGRAEQVLKETEQKRSLAQQVMVLYARQIRSTIESYKLKVLREMKKQSVFEKLVKTERTFFLEGWVPESKETEFAHLVDHATNGLAELELTEPDESSSSIPTRLNNPKPFHYFEMLSNMFSVPHYNEVDPTPFLFFSFVLFFGIMFADIAGGLLLLAASFLVFKGAGSQSSDLKRVTQILMIASLSAIFFGFLAGDFAGFELYKKASFLEPINLLYFSISLGVIQIVLGLLIGLWNQIRQRNWAKALGSQVSWLLIVFSGLSAILLNNTALAIPLFVVGLLLILWEEGIQGALELPRILSNVFSYVRILALNMAHVGLSATFASLAYTLLSIPLVGWLSAVLLIVIAQLFIVFISVFAVFAHTLRLHYVEFFSKFYQGGGVKFDPL